MFKSKNILTILLIIVGLLLVADILTRYWFWSKLDLKYDSLRFNNIVTPIVGIVSFIVYSVALWFAFDQNKILRSQNLKPHFESEIERIRTELKKYDLDFANGTGLNYCKYVKIALTNIKKSPDYQFDLSQFKKGFLGSQEHLMIQNYWEDLLFLNDFIDSKIDEIHKDLMFFINEVDLSKLIKDDKDYFKKRVRNEFIEDFFTLIEGDTENREVENLEIPILSEENFNFQIPFKPFNQTRIRELYVYYSKRLNYLHDDIFNRTRV